MLLWGIRQSGSDRIVLNVVLYTNKLLVRAHHPVIALILPERLAGASEQEVGVFSVGAFKEPRSFGTFVSGVISKCT